jgi:hypothetical protein
MPKTFLGWIILIVCVGVFLNVVGQNPHMWRGTVQQTSQGFWQGFLPPIIEFIFAPIVSAALLGGAVIVVVMGAYKFYRNRPPPRLHRDAPRIPPREQRRIEPPKKKFWE